MNTDKHELALFMEKLLDGVEVKWSPLEMYMDYEQPTKYLVKSTLYNDKYSTPVLPMKQMEFMRPQKILS